MGDIRTTSYQGAELQKLAASDEQIINIYQDTPDQFWQFDNMLYNPLDFFTSSGEFNLALFNKSFRDEQQRRMDYYNDLEQQRLNDLNILQKAKPKLLDLTIGEHLIQMKDTPFDMFKDLTNAPLNSEILLKNNRLFYIGLFFLFIFIMYLILNNLVSSAQ